MEENRTQPTRQFEARLASKADSKLVWLAGLYYYHTDNTGTFKDVIYPGANFSQPPLAGTAGTVGSTAPCPFTAAATGIFCYDWQNQTAGIQETKAAYANATYPVLANLRLIGSLRYQTDFKRTAGTLAGALRGNAISFVDNPILYYDQAQDWKNTQYRVGVEYDITPQSMAYVTYQTGYQPGNITLVGGGMGMGADYAPATSSTASAPLKLKQTTLGIKNRFFDNKLQLNFEAWNTDFQDRPTTFPGVNSLFNNNTFVATAVNSCGNATNNFDSTGNFRAAFTATDACIVTGSTIANTVADQLSQGVDVEINFVPTANDRLDVTFEYLKSRYKNAPHMTGLSALAVPTVADILAIAAFPGATAANRNATATNIAAATPLAQQAVDAWNGSIQAFTKIILQGSSSRSATLSYQHVFRMDNGASFTPRVAATYRSQFWVAGGGGQASIQAINAFLANPQSTFVAGVQRGYSKVDLFGTWQNGDGKFSLTGYVKNVGNKATIQNSTATYTSLDAPRTYGAIFSANF
jgi:outer membrane receptor protein involved in Fe transport